MAMSALYDGHSAVRHEVAVTLDDSRGVLVVMRAGTSDLLWPLAALRRVDASAGVLVLALADADAAHDGRAAARLVVTDPELIERLRRVAPALDRRDVKAGTLRRVLLSLGAAVAAVVFLLFVFLPFVSDRLAEALPLETEQRFGQAVVAQIEGLLDEGDGTGLVCDDPAGQAALARLTARLTERQELSYSIDIRVLDHEMVNAFAAPGGHVVLLRGLIDEAATPDEVAGVIAHEIGHVEARDPTRLSFRAAGSAGILSLILGDVTGGAVVAFAGEYLMSASYTREAEAAADLFAHRMLERAGISSAGMAAFFDRIDGMDGDIPGYLSTHPASGGRAEAARAADGGGTPALSDADWQALRAICG